MATNRAWNNGGRKMVAYLSRVLVVLKLPDRYHPERHYMRGPGPKWLAKHRNCDECRTRSSCPVIDGYDSDGSATAVGPETIVASSTKVRVRTRRIIHSLAATVTALFICGMSQISAAEDPETARDIIATQIRSQGYRCNHPETAARDADASKPDEFAWRLQCGQGSYLVRLIPHIAARVERVGQ
jgi:hypothetical protein